MKANLESKTTNRFVNYSRVECGYVRKVTFNDTELSPEVVLAKPWKGQYRISH